MLERESWRDEGKDVEDGGCCECWRELERWKDVEVLGRVDMWMVEVQQKCGGDGGMMEKWSEK